MDPDACLARLRAAVADGDQEEARYLRAALRTWVAMGGFSPRDPDWRDV